MTAPSGEQYEIASGPYRATITESGGALRALGHDGRPLIDGFGADEMSPGGRGQLLMPWPNRVRDGKYTFGGRDLQLPLTEPARQNASHGLVRWVAWTLDDHTPDRVALRYRLMAQTGWPWTLDLQVEYALTDAGLTVTQSATNRASGPAPYAAGAHPYLCVGDGPVDGLELTLPAARRFLCDDRLLPVGDEDVTGTPYDFRTARVLGQTSLDDGFTDLARDEEGLAVTTLRDPGSGQGWSCGSTRPGRASSSSPPTTSRTRPAARSRSSR